MTLISPSYNSGFSFTHSLFDLKWFNVYTEGQVRAMMYVSSYADDTQLYISAEPSDAAAIDSTWLLVIGKWMCKNLLKLNEDNPILLPALINYLENSRL